MRVNGLVLAVLLVTSGMAGCIGGDDAASPSEASSSPSPNASLALDDAVTAMDECTFACFEPTVAVDPEGRIFVAEGAAMNRSGDTQFRGPAGAGLVRSTDGGATFEPLGVPQIPGNALPETVQGDSLVQVGPDGSLYFSALLGNGLDPATVLYGIQVARSDDGGETWATNTVISVTEDPQSGAFDTDRQWLGFGSDGTVYLSYAHYPAPLGVFLHHSDDRGETWSEPSVVATAAERAAYRGVWSGQAGPPVVDGQGTVYVPMVWATEELQEPPAVRVAASTDQGSSWEHHEAFRAPVAGDGFPMLTVDAQDRLHLAALSGEGLTVTTSTDGAQTWNDPTRWTDRDPPNGTAPWIETVDGNLTVAYYENDGNGSVSLELAQRPLDADRGTGFTERVTVAEGLPSAHTDFAHFVEGPSGPWVTWGDANAEEILLAGPGPTPAGSR